MARRFFLTHFLLTLSSWFCIVDLSLAETYSVSPKSGLSRSVAALKPGDILHLSDGTYSEPVKFTVSGTKEAPIIIEGSEKVMIDGKHLGPYTPVFQTNGQNYLQFKNLNFVGVRAGVQIDGGSHHVLVDGLRADQCQFAVKMTDASFVTIKNAYADNSRNAFRGEGDTHHITFENIEAYHSKDIHKNRDLNYFNGDGFIFEDNTHDLVFKNIKTGGHWDAGLDIKGSRVRLENIISFGNKNGLKLWGKDIEMSNALIYGCKAQMRPDGTRVDGWGINVRQGSVKIANATIVDNEAGNIKARDGSSAKISNSILAQRVAGRKLVEKFGNWTYDNIIWYHAAEQQPEWLKASEKHLWTDPRFMDWEKGDYRLKDDNPGFKTQKDNLIDRVGFLGQLSE